MIKIDFGVNDMHKKRTNVKKMVLAAVFAAIIIVMTFVPYTGYIQYLPGGVAITTLHIPVMIAAVFLGGKYGGVIGGIWGCTCLLLAFLNPDPGNVPFQNPVISVLPRVIVGMVTAWVFAAVKGKKQSRGRGLLAVISATLAGTLTNTVLVLSLLHFVGSVGTTNIAELFNSIIMTVVGINGAIELAAALIIVPAVWSALEKTYRERFER